MISSLALWAITVGLMAIGLLGTIIPGLPGIVLTYAGILIFAFATNFAHISPTTLVVFGLVTALAVIAGYFGSVLGSRAGGGKKWAIIGTFVGAILGAFTGPLGLFLGAFLGALLGAFIEGSSTHQAFKIAV